MGAAAENGGLQGGTIGDMERASFGDKDLHCLMKCGPAMRYPVSLFGGLDLGEEDDNDDRRESDNK
jgi:hypothetical protein